ncbi:MAG: hypothetical protein JNJ48_05460 [Phycisphaerae bacterium]|nr:hypothetical protein [Phycisphaerae bacterium]
MTRRSLPTALLACLLAPGSFLCSATAQPPGPAPSPAPSPNYKPEAGGFDVGTVETLTLRDDRRSKDLEVLVRFPRAKAGSPAGPFPMVIFSHGAGGSKAAFPELTRAWASHGYVVVLPTHSDSILQRRRDGKDTPAITTEQGRRDLRGQVDLNDRVADVKFILDSIEAIESRIDGLRNADGTGRIDRSRLAMAGHSAGAFTTQLAVGVRARGLMIEGRRSLELRSIADERLRCGLIISGQGTASPMLDASSWDRLAVPILAVSGSLDTSPPQMGNETPESRTHPFVHSRGTAKGGPPAYLLYIEGATHSSYGGRATSSLLGEKPTTDVKLIQRAVLDATLAMLDAHLRDDAGARDYLAGDRLASVIPGKVRWERK